MSPENVDPRTAGAQAGDDLDQAEVDEALMRGHLASLAGDEMHGTTGEAPPPRRLPSTGDPALDAIDEYFAGRAR